MLLRGRLELLQAGGAPPNEVLLYGPRGNGKTVLLSWLEQEARDAGVRTIRLVPSAIPDVAALVEVVRGRSWRGRLREVALRGFAVRLAARRPEQLHEALAAETPKSPLLALVDEAHTLDLDVGRDLLNASQIVGRQGPFQLVLAGTPHLRSHLGRMGASFWNRAELRRIGRLTGKAAAEAFARPLETARIAVSGGVLSRMVRASQCYPYFVQLLGQSIWEQVGHDSNGGRTVTPDVLASALAAFEDRRNDYYLDRYNELDELGLLGAASAVGEAFREKPLLTPEEVRRAIAGGAAGILDPPDAARALEEVGFVWQATPTPRYEPGIPSLVDYVLDNAP